MALRSGVVKPPKSIRCASAQACTRIPLVGVRARSAAISAAEPRKKAKGDSLMPPKPERDEIQQTAFVGRLQDVNRITTIAGRLPAPV